MVWNDISDAATWIGHIALISRYDMHVQMGHGLTCRLANIDPNIESQGIILGLDLILYGIDNLKELGLLLWCGFEPASHVAVRDDQSVSVRHGVLIPNSSDEFTLEEDTTFLGWTERAGAFVHRFALARLRVISIV
ncbi:uncharacterized protein METZ01_LOCUS281213, partial [marine metagenome]